VHLVQKVTIEDLCRIWQN